MVWEVIAFETGRGEKPVEEYIRSQEIATIAKIAHSIDLLEKHGPYLGMPHAKKISADLYELRMRGKQEIRILYTFSKRNIYLLHAFSKKRSTLPRKEIKVAQQRLVDLTNI